MQENKEKISFAFFGTPEVASQTLEILISNGLVPEVVITSPDRPSGRGLQMQSTPVKILADKHNIPILSPEKLDSDFILKLSKFTFDVSIVVAYGKLLSKDIIDIPNHGTINIHYSLLPKYRGASPLESALLNGDTETGVSIQKMVLKMDAGPIIAEEKVAIDINTNKEDLREILIEKGANLLIRILPDYVNGKITPVPQNENLATHCAKIEKKDGEINPNGDDLENWNKYRAYSGWPGVFFFREDPLRTLVTSPLAGGEKINKTRVKITKARFENGKFIIEKVIPEGKKEQDYLL